MSMYNQENYFFEHLLDCVLERYEEKPSLKLYDNYAYALLCLSYLKKDHISDELKVKLANFIDGKKSSSDYNTTHWARLPQLLATDYLLNRNSDSLSLLLKNVSCSQSADRRHHILSTAWLCEVISFDNTTLQRSFEINRSRLHGYWHENLLLILNCRGDLNQRNQWFKRISESLKGNEYLSNAIEQKGLFLCSTFKDHFDSVIIYTAEQFVKSLTPFSDVSDFNVLVQQISNHPLNKSVFVFPQP